MFRSHQLILCSFDRYVRILFVAGLGCLLILLASSPGGTASVAGDELTVREFRTHLETFVKQSKSKSPAVQRVAVFNLCQLHIALVTDPKFSGSLRLQGFRTTIQNRLKAYCKQVRKETARVEPAAAKRTRSTLVPLSADAGVLDPNEPPTRPPNLASKAGESDVVIHPLLGPIEDELDLMVFDSLGMAYGTSNQLAGGPSTLFNRLGGRFGPPWDHGPELVALIETTIDPEFWRSGGGQGAISYYQPAQALVISASQEIHDRVYDLLIKLGARGG